MKISKYYEHCDIIVAHVSTVEDINGDLSAERSISYEADIPFPVFRGKFYKKHLGFWGTVCLIHDLINENRSNRIILLSEFGEEMLINRTSIVDEIRNYVRNFGNECHSQQANNIFISDITAS